MEHVFSVTSIDELKDVMPDSGGAVLVAGHTRPGDGGGGVFHWVAGSTLPGDDGIVVQGHNASGRWHRAEQRPVNVRWYGVTGDGTDASKGIQRALDACRQGGTVYLPSGTYVISRPLRIYQGTHFYGDGLLTVLKYVGPPDSGCLRSATPQANCAFNVSRVNLEIMTEGAWGVDLRGMSYSRFDHTFMHLRKHKTSGFYGPGDTRSPYYNLFTNCHVSGPGQHETNGCIAFNFAWDRATRDQSANANQVVGGHVNSCQVAVACYGTGNVFYGQVIEQCDDGYVFGLVPARVDAVSKGTVNSIAGCYTEYVRRVIVQQHAECAVTAELTHTTGYETVFDAQDTQNCIVLTSHDGRLASSRSLMHRRIDLRVP